MCDAATFALADARVAVRFETPGFADWLEEMLLPGFTRVEDGPVAATVVVRRSCGERADDREGEPLGPLPCFVFDGEVVYQPAWRIGHEVALTDEKYGARYLMRPASVEVHADGPWPRARVAALRVVREVAVAQSLSDGHRMRLHASGVEDAGRVVLLAGPKWAGKTTLVAHLASSNRVGLVANDCALISRSNSGAWEARAIPVSVSVRPETMERLPHLFHGVAAVESLSHLTMAEAELARAWRGTVAAPTRLKLSPALFAKALQTSLSGGGSLARVALVAADDDAVGYALRPLEAAEAERRLTPLRYGFEPHAATRTVFDEFLDTHRPASADAEFVRRLAAEVPCAELRVGPDMLRSRDAASDLLAELLLGA